MNQNKVELLAPAGNTESFYAALNAGADAIYFAGSKFGARAYADNFSEEEVVTAIKTAHIYGVRVYMTVNTLLKQVEIEELYEYILPFYEAGLDGVIIQDMGVFHFLRKHFPGLELHISTQVSLCTSEGASFMKEQGACRIVPAREISLTEIKEIKKNVAIQIESFVHGAMCYCYSGQCLFSSILGGRSGNRGRCAQPCRLPYSVKNGKALTEGHLLSLKDMCTIYQLPDLIEAGIDSFKIEGRMKRPEYVAGVCSIYRKYINLYYSLREQFGIEQAKQSYSISKEDQKLLQSLYIRSEIHNGYYEKHNGKEMITLDSPAYTETKEELLINIREKYLNVTRKLPISVYGYFEVGYPAIVSLSFGEYSVSVEGNSVEQASKVPITEENVRKQLCKLGDSPFACDQFNCQIGENAFYPLKLMNELRREATDLLKEQILASYCTTPKVAIPLQDQSAIISERKGTGIVLSVKQTEQLEAALSFRNDHPDINYKAVHIDADSYLNHREHYDDLIKLLPKETIVSLALPYIIRNQDKQYFECIKKILQNHSIVKAVLVRSMDGYAFAVNYFKNYSIYLDANVYTWNNEAVQFFENQVEGYSIPYELKAAEQHKLPLKDYCFDKIVYSRIPMMITANCIRKTSEKCDSKNQTELKLKDRYGKEFPVITNCNHCYNVIYNSVPFSLHKELTKWESLVNPRLDFTMEKDFEVKNILTFFLIDHGIGECPYEYTTGHEKRGVE